MKNIKALLFALIIAGLFSYVKAQDNPPPAPAPMPPYNEPITNYNPSGYLAFHFGLAQPMDMFASTSGTTYGGYAMPGTAFSLSAGVPVSGSNFGIALMFGSYSNPFNESKYAVNVQQTDQARSYSSDLQDEYVTSSVLVGPFITIPVNKVSFDFKALFGAVLCRLPEVGYSAYQYNPTLGTTSTYSWDIAPSNSSVLAYGLGAGVRYNFGYWAIMANADYLYANPMYNTNMQYTDPAGNQTYNGMNGSIPISLMSFTLGFGYQIR
ncbi:MAG TPA: hypothetical protein VNY36_09540 [Bacteroidia bacterium]|jgi:hypothetical protein|nr:hypothetical protein [Bacteroidia bacterium]